MSLFCLSYVFVCGHVLFLLSTLLHCAAEIEDDVYRTSPAVGAVRAETWNIPRLTVFVMFL